MQQMKASSCPCILTCTLLLQQLQFALLCMLVLQLLSNGAFCAAGAQNDLERVTKMAYAQVGIYGMNKKVGLLSFPQDDNRFDKPYSNETARLIDDEARGLLDAAYARTVAIVSERRDLVQALADELLSKEVCAHCVCSTVQLEQIKAVDCPLTLRSSG